MDPFSSFSNEDMSPPPPSSSSSKRRRPVPQPPWTVRLPVFRIGRSNRRFFGPTTARRFNRPANRTTVSTPMTRPKYDVFLSYSSDIGDDFVSFLKGALETNCFDICDRTTLPIGQDRSSELLKAIEESWICVVVFSIQYPFSVECLDELVLIRDSISKSKNGRRVFPIFYKVIPSHVRSQEHGPFLQAFQEHHDNHVNGEKVISWKHALEEVGNLEGQQCQTWDNGHKFVCETVKQLMKLKLPLVQFYAEHPVGIEPRVEDFVSKLRLRDLKPSITAVFGISGAGKTALLKAVYDTIVQDFDISCFIEDIRYYKHNVPNWKVDLQRDVISRLTGDDYRIHNVSDSNIRKLVISQKVLLVIDGIDKSYQLQALGIHGPASLAPGSRMLVTTTNKQCLSHLKEYTSYHIKLFNDQESSELFTALAYEKGQSADTKFVDEIVFRAGGVPLVLEIWGHYFKRHERKQWPSLLEILRRIPNEDVQQKLRVGYDALSPRAKKLFLDIACFFDGMKNDFVIEVLQDEDNVFFPDIVIQDLIDRCLVKVDEFDRLRMPDLIREMGQEVVRQENEDEPGKRSRLVGEKDVDTYQEVRGCANLGSCIDRLFGN